MESNKKNAAPGGGITFPGLLTICFIVLKLTGVIHWSGVWVLAPLWISAVVIFVIVLIVFAVIEFQKGNKRRRFRKE